MKASVFFTDNFQAAYRMLIEQELPITEVDKIVKIDQEIGDCKQKIIDFKDAEFAKMNEAIERAKIDPKSERAKEHLKILNDRVNEFANGIDFVPSVKLDKQMLIGIRLSAKNYAQLIEFFE